MNFSKYQKAIFKFCRKGKGSLIVQAVAGSGKTTTAIEAMDNCEGYSTFLAFNKTIADELKSRGCNARTFHSICFTPVMKFVKTKNLDSDKVRKLIRKHLSWDENKIYGNTINKLVGLGKQSGVGHLVGYDEFQRLFFHHGLELDTNMGTLPELFSLTKMIFDCSVNDNTSVDFDDLLYIAVREQLNLPKFDNIFIDEAQDTNAIQRAIVKLMSKSKTRIIAFGDRYQSIYGFRGADFNAMQLIKDEFNCEELPLSISYRCPKKVVEFAQLYNKEIESSPTADDGAVEHLDTRWTHETFKKRDMVICRTTKPIIALAYKLLNQKVSVTVLGRDIGKGLTSLIAKMNAETLDQLKENLIQYAIKEIEKLQAKDQLAKIESLRDKVDTVLSLIEGMSVSGTIQELLSVIETLFDDTKEKAVIFSTIHKAKGLEAKNIYWLNYHDCPAKWAKKDWEKQQELNLCYVAITRAKERLILIKEKARDSR